MNEIFIILLVFLFILIFDFRHVIKEKEKKIIIFYSISFVLSLTLVLLKTFHVTIYGPTQLISDIAKALKII